MPNERIVDLTEDTTPADGDLVVTVDVSDTTDDASGSSKKVQAQNLVVKKLRTSTGPAVLTVGAVVDGEFLKRSGTSIISAAAGGGGGLGDVVGPASAADNALVRFDSTTGKLIQNSTVTLDDTGAIIVPEMAAPSTPASGKVAVYAKTDGKLYIKDDAGTETDLTDAGAASIAPLVIEDANTVSQRNSTNAQEFRVYSSDGGATWGRLRIEKESGSWRIVSETNAGVSDGDIQFYLGSANLAWNGTSFQPSSNGSVSLGGGLNQWNEVHCQNVQLGGSYLRWSSPDLELQANATGRLHIKTSVGAGGTGLLIGDVNSNGFILKKSGSGHPEIRLGDDSAYHAMVALKFGYSGTSVCDFAGSGSPEGAVTANVGSTYRRTDGGAGTSFYVKESGTGNTGWVAK